MLFLTLFERPFSPQQTPHTPSKLADSLMKITDEDVDQPKKGKIFCVKAGFTLRDKNSRNLDN